MPVHPIYFLELAEIVKETSSINKESSWASSLSSLYSNFGNFYNKLGPFSGQAFCSVKFFQDTNAKDFCIPLK